MSRRAPGTLSPLLVILVLGLATLICLGSSPAVGAGDAHRAPAHGTAGDGGHDAAPGGAHGGGPAADHGDAHGEEHHGGGELQRFVNSTLVFGGLFLLLRKRGRDWVRARSESVVAHLREVRAEAKQREEELAEERQLAERMDEEAEAARTRASEPLLNQARAAEADAVEEISRLEARQQALEQHATEEARRELLQEAATKVTSRTRDKVGGLLTPETHRSLVETFLQALERAAGETS